MKGETQMTRMRMLLARAFVIALLLLALGGGVASADPGTTGPAFTTTLPDDPGYTGLLLPDDPGYGP